MNNISGRLNRKIELWQHVQTEEKNSIGQKKWEETKVKDVWAEVKPQTGSLLSGRAAESTLSRTTHKITVRYDSSITPGMWFMAGGQRYEILYILNPYLTGEVLEIFCEVVI